MMQLASVTTQSNPLRVIVGAGSTTQPGWLSLEERDLDITDERQWAERFTPNSIDAILAEHVFEHLTPAESVNAARNFYTYLKPGDPAQRGTLVSRSAGP